jgi:hypothetical protein
MQEDSPVFKSKTMQEPGVKKRLWKSLKQIQTTERNVFGVNSDAVLCEMKLYIFFNLNNYLALNSDSSINAPPSFKPPKKYSDMTGLVASYTCPVSKIYYHNSAEYKVVKKMPSDISKGYKGLRGASSVV